MGPTAHKEYQPNPDSRNAIKFQLRSGAAIKKSEDRNTSTTIDSISAQSIVDTVNATIGSDDLTTLIAPLNEMIETMYKMEQEIKETTPDCNPIITFSEALADMTQLKVDINKKTTGRILGARVAEEENTRPVKKSSI